MGQTVILGIMQPYFFPYLGYFDLINYSDEWIVFDTVQYIRKGWMNRNRIFNFQGDWQYITVPVKKHHQDTLIQDIVIHPNWQAKMIGQIEVYRKSAPYFTETKDLLDECFALSEELLSELNTKILEKVCVYLTIPFHYTYFSQMHLDIDPVTGPGDWALHIAKSLGAKEYVNPPGGESLFNSAAFEKLGMKLTIRDIPPMTYSPGKYNFIPRLSIVDVLMWNSPGDIKKYLDKQKN
jgi:hypothetical protein